MSSTLSPEDELESDAAFLLYEVAQFVTWHDGYWLTNEVTPDKIDELADALRKVAQVRRVEEGEAE